MPRASCVFTLASLALVVALAVAAPAQAQFDPALHAKAAAFQAFADTWHTTARGALTGGLRFTDDTYTEIECVHHQGDSTIWSGEYLAAQAFQYMVTGDPVAKAAAEEMAWYLHYAMQITETLGYVARWAGPDEPPYNCGYDDGNGWKVHGMGEFAGDYWVDHTSRDQYTGWLMGMSTAHDALDDPLLLAAIEQDFRDIIEMLETNLWNITDQNGEWTGNGAAWLGPSGRLAWIAMAAHVTGDDYYWQLLDTQYELWKRALWIDTFAGLNKYMEYFGNNLRHVNFLSMFRYWPDRERLEDLWDIWQSANRPYVKETHNPFFDAVHVAGCLRLGNCDSDEYDWIEADFLNTLGRYDESPAYKRARTCSDQPLDTFSVWADGFLAQYPWLEDIVDINPQSAVARELDDRHWTDMYWQSTPWEAGCDHGADDTFVGPGMDYLLAYWMGVYYGILPGGGPFGDDDFTDDDDDDDTSGDDDAADDDFDDDAADDDDDASDDDAIDDDSAAGDDDTDDDAANDDVSGGDDDDDDDDGACGC
ncbi:hypothetical protein K8I61_16260 [bacterium]|nr:hypothetical protein [bacterium]